MKILIVSVSQFGYLIDYHRYYTYLKGKGYDVKYMCWDFGNERLEPGNPDIIYVPRHGGMLRRLPRLIQEVVKYDKKMRFDRILVNNFKMVSSLLLFIPNRKIYFDIRQVSVHTKKYKRKLFDGMMAFAARRFKNTSIITDLAAKHIGITRYRLLPLGGAYFPVATANDPETEQYRSLLAGNDFIFLYVGTLFKRRLLDTVVGFHEYLKKNPGTAAKYILIGNSFGNELETIREYIKSNGIENHVHALGYIPQKRLALFFQEADCGITYSPLTAFNDVQPNTKTYEYLINGMPVIATATKDNIKLLEHSGIECGIVIKDNAQDFERAVGGIISRYDLYDKEAIAAKFSEYEWDNLFRQHLDKILDLPDHPAKMMNDVLFVGPDHGTHRGGIAAVLDTYSAHIRPFKFISSYNNSGFLSRQFLFLKAAISLIRSLIGDKDIRIVHVHSAAKGSFIRKSILLRIARLFGRKTVLHMHSGSFHTYYEHAGILRPYIRRVFRKADVVVCLSQKWYEFYSTEFRIKRLVIIKNVIERPADLPQPLSSAGPLKLLFLGMVVEKKGIFDLLKVMAMHPDLFGGKVQLTIGGKGEEERLAETLRNKDLSGHVKFEGWVVGEKKNELLKNCDIFILPSHIEGLPISILEAMANGKPIISTVVGGIPEIVIPGRNGWLFQPGNLDELRNVLAEAIADRQRLKQYGENSYLLSESYSPNMVMESLRGVYDQLLID